MSIYSDEDKQLVQDWFSRRRGKSARMSTVFKELMNKEGMSRLKLEKILEHFLQENVISSASNTLHGYLKYTEKPLTEDSQIQWQKVLGTDPELLTLLPCHTALADWTTADRQKLLEGLIKLKAALPAAYAMSCYEASAHYLLGSSKLLDSLNKRSLQQFGIDPDRFQAASTYVVIAGPENPEQVLLVENPQSFEVCIQAGLHHRMGLVSTYGYGLQWNQVLENQDSVVGIARAGNPGNLKSLLAHSKLYFWGDLDHEGIRIFHSIKSKCPPCQLSNLYRPMVEALKSGKGHPYSKATGKPDQKPSELLNGHESAVDQEFVDSELLLMHCNGGLSPDSLNYLLNS